MQSRSKWLLALLGAVRITFVGAGADDKKGSNAAAPEGTKEAMRVFPFRGAAIIGP